jgi:hypothetical protein
MEGRVKKNKKSRQKKKPELPLTQKNKRLKKGSAARRINRTTNY